MLELNISGSEQIGIKRIFVKWNQINDFEYTICRCHVSISENRIESFGEHLEFCWYLDLNSFSFLSVSSFSDDSMPKYYEQVNKEEQTTSSNEMDCSKDCINKDDCIQFVFYDSECYLKTRLELSNGISSNYKNATVRSIKSIFIPINSSSCSIRCIQLKLKIEN